MTPFRYTDWLLSREEFQKRSSEDHLWKQLQGVVLSASFWLCLLAWFHFGPWSALLWLPSLMASMLFGQAIQDKFQRSKVLAAVQARLTLPAVVRQEVVEVEYKGVRDTGCLMNTDGWLIFEGSKLRFQIRPADVLELKRSSIMLVTGQSIRFRNRLDRVSGIDITLAVHDLKLIEGWRSSGVNPEGTSLYPPLEAPKFNGFPWINFVRILFALCFAAHFGSHFLASHLWVVGYLFVATIVNMGGITEYVWDRLVGQLRKSHRQISSPKVELPTTATSEELTDELGVSS